MTNLYDMIFMFMAEHDDEVEEFFFMGFLAKIIRK